MTTSFATIEHCIAAIMFKLDLAILEGAMCTLLLTGNQISVTIAVAKDLTIAPNGCPQ